MAARSNFGEVALSGDGSTLQISGRSEDPVTQVFASVVRRPQGDARVPPFSELTGQFLGNVVVSTWLIEIGLDDEHPFAEGDAVLVAGAALRDDGDHDVWVDSVRLTRA